MMQVRAATASDPPFDLIAGCAGAIPPLLLLAAEPGLEYCEGLAIRCGERLCATAAWEDGQCAWSPSPGAAAGTPLTGMSHGATGPARALLELHARTGHAPFLRTARGAFAYEDSFYSPAAENWVDTRSPYSGEPGNRTGRCISAWCHGAPGIALARARAAILDVEMAERHSATVRRAASTIFATLDARLADDDGDATLCHGTAGLSEIALTLGGLMSDGEWEERAIAAAHELAANHDPESYWPSGVSAGGPNPTLMIGASGVGHHFLRVAFPDKVPSVLLLSP
jgi:lantibiotic modifying enzyme